MLAIVTFTLNSVAFFFVRLLPPSHSKYPLRSEHGHSDAQILRRAKPHDDRRLEPIAGVEPAGALQGRKSVESSSNLGIYDGTLETLTADSHETSSLLSKSSESGTEEYGLVRETSTDQRTEDVDIRGLALLAKTEFWQLFLIFGLLSGIGLMNIK
jgi:hypothetical protein